MKATMSKDGVPRFTLTMRRRVGALALVDAMGWKAMRDAEGIYTAEDQPAAVAKALKPLASRKAVMAAAQEAYAHDGDSVWTWADNCPCPDEVRAQARAIVKRKFPELGEAA